MSKSPAFQFYVNDWLGSMNIMLMTPAQEGAYVRLLAIAWGSEDCGLPDDDTELAILSRLGEGWLKGGSTVVRKCFFSEGGRLFNKRLLEEREKQKAWREKSAAGGRKSGKARRRKKLAIAKGGCEMVATKREPNTNSSTSSSSSISSTISSTKDNTAGAVVPPHFTCKFFSITEAEHERYTTTYLFADIDRAYQDMSTWLYANPKKAHKKDWSRFVNRWLKSNDDDAEMEAKNRTAKDRGTVREKPKFNNAPCIVCGETIGLDTCVVVMKADKNEHGFPVQIDMGVSHSTEGCYNKPPRFTATGEPLEQDTGKEN